MYLSRADQEINTRETFQVLFQESLGIILSYLLSCHFNNSKMIYKTNNV
jgi:LPS O-antigen subunit length determinant protein (WzzB/FepE family)